ncbi:Uncharacterised protein [Mycobacteroides abscessus subsp. abscessus]|nr:Uncharacterised protein [Mycobacteroides abscessus subsp. abscessus]
MEAQAALVRTEGGVELHPETAVDLHAPLVVDPGHAEDDLALGLAQPPQDGAVGVLGVLGHDRAEAFQYLEGGLMELDLAGVAPQDLLVDLVQLLVQDSHAGDLPPRLHPLTHRSV